MRRHGRVRRWRTRAGARARRRRNHGRACAGQTFRRTRCHRGRCSARRRHTAVRRDAARWRHALLGRAPRWHQALRRAPHRRRLGLGGRPAKVRLARWRERRRRLSSDCSDVPLELLGASRDVRVSTLPRHDVERPPLLRMAHLTRAHRCSVTSLPQRTMTEISDCNRNSLELSLHAPRAE